MWSKEAAAEWPIKSQNNGKNVLSHRPHVKHEGLHSDTYGERNKTLPVVGCACCEQSRMFRNNRQQVLVSSARIMVLDASRFLI